MSDQNKADPARAAKLAQQIVEILINEDSDTWRRAVQAAVALLGGGISSHVDGPRNGKDAGAGNQNQTDLATFFNRDDDFKPADYAQLCAAFHFSQYGTTPFSLADLRTIASDAGVVLPDRLDMTLNQTAKKGRKLFQTAGRGLFKPTATAGFLFKERWGVRPGNRTKATAEVKEV